MKAVNTPQTKSKGNNDDTITAQHMKTKTESSAKIARIICSKVIFYDHCTYAVPRKQKETYFGWKNSFTSPKQQIRIGELQQNFNMTQGTRTGLLACWAK